MSRNTIHFFISGAVALAVSGVVSTTMQGYIIAQTPPPDGGAQPVSAPAPTSPPASSFMPSMPPPGPTPGIAPGQGMPPPEMHGIPPPGMTSGMSTSGNFGMPGGAGSFPGMQSPGSMGSFPGMQGPGGMGDFMRGGPGGMGADEIRRTMEQQIREGVTRGIGEQMHSLPNFGMPPMGNSPFGERSEQSDRHGPPSDMFSMPSMRNGMESGHKSGMPFGDRGEGQNRGMGSMMGGNPFGSGMPNFHFSGPRNNPLVDKWTNVEIPDTKEEELTDAQRAKLQKNYEQLKKLLAKAEKEEKRELKKAEKDYAKAQKQCTKAKTEEQKKYCAGLAAQVQEYIASIKEAHEEKRDEIITAKEEISEALGLDSVE